MLKLSEMKVGSHCKVETVECENCQLRQRLLAMGIVAGTDIEVVQIAPLGDPIKIKALGYELSLRISEADSILVSTV